VLSDRQRREYDRATITPQVPLECLADEGGVLSFKGGLVDISIGGLGFLVYDPNITLEPGTLLRGCRIALPGGGECLADLEVRYTQAITMPNGRRALRSGCRFLTASPQLAALAKRVLGG